MVSSNCNLAPQFLIPQQYDTFAFTQSLCSGTKTLKKTNFMVTNHFSSFDNNGNNQIYIAPNLPMKDAQRCSTFKVNVYNKLSR